MHSFEFNSMSNRIVHIGYPKTATSFLQSDVFPYFKDIGYFDFYQSREIFQDLQKQSTLHYTGDSIKKHVAQNPNSLYSYEWLVGYPAKGYFNYEIAHRLKDAGFDKIIIGIRDKWAMIESMYRQYVHHGGVMRMKHYLNDYFDMSYLDYDKLIELYKELFGKENVLVYKHEDLKSDYDGVVRALTEFVGAELTESLPSRTRHKSLCSTSIKILRLINHCTYNRYRPSHLISKRITTWKFKRLLEIMDPFIRKIFKDKKLVAKYIPE